MWRVKLFGYKTSYLFGRDEFEGAFFIMLRNVFCIEERTEPISYEEFAAIGMSKEAYLLYIAHCDRLRATVILYDYVYGFSAPSDLKNEHDRKSLEKICKTCLNELLEVLQPFCKENINLVDLASKKITIIGLTLGTSYYKCFRFSGHAITEPPPAILYRNLDDFRIFIEQILFKLINGIFPIFEVEIEPEMEDMTLNELEFRAEWKHELEQYDSEPVFPTASGKSSDIFSWAEKAERYERHQDIIFGYDSIDEVIECKKAAEFDAQKNTLFIYRNTLICKLRKHKLEEVTAVIELPESSRKRAYLNISYCHDCKKFFIEEQSYIVYREKYEFLPVCFAYVGENRTFSNYKNRNEKSPLLLCGYSVSKKDGLSKEKRQMLLSWIMDHNVKGLGKREIKAHLEMLIETNGNNPNNELAREKWKDDLQFVNDYEIDKQETVFIQKVDQN